MDDVLLSVIPVGKENALHQAEIAKLLGVSPESVKWMVREVRYNGIEVLSGRQGYWLPKDDLERQAFRKSHLKHAFTRFQTVKPINDALRQNDAQISLFEGLNGTFEGKIKG